MAEPRLYVQVPLGEGIPVTPAPPQAHYLQRVMRLVAGDTVRLFNGHDGEWRAKLRLTGRDLRLDPLERVRTQQATVGPVLAFAPIRRQRLEWLVEKAVELGATALQPVRTRRSEAGLGPVRRLEAIMAEAAEQCGRLDVPPLRPMIDLTGLPHGGSAPVIVLDPLADRRLPEVMEPGRPPMVVIGPEGGLDPKELTALLAHPGVTSARLCPLVLRAETAALVALATWQATREP